MVGGNPVIGMLYYIYKAALNKNMRGQVNMVLHENIRTIRKEKGLTQEQLADAMGVSTASVSKWETGVAAPELTVLADLADYFAVSIDALMGHEIDRVQLDEKIQEIRKLSLEMQDEAAIEGAEKLLRRYPNEYRVVEVAYRVYYSAFIRTADKSKMQRAIELIHRQFDLIGNGDWKKWFELRANLANCHELLQEWDKAKAYYEESNVAGNNDLSLGRCLTRMGEHDKALATTSEVIEQLIFQLTTAILQLAEIWQAKEEPEKAKAVLRWGADLVERGGNLAKTYETVLLAMLISLVSMEEESGEKELAEEHVRRAIRAELGKVTVGEQVEFLASERKVTILESDFGGNSKVLAWLSGMEDDRLLKVAKEEMGKY